MAVFVSLQKDEEKEEEEEEKKEETKPLFKVAYLGNA